MVFSIPQTIHPEYSSPPPLQSMLQLNIGASIKDLPPGSDTIMKKANDYAIIRIKQQFDADTLKFEKDLEAAKIKAESSKKLIGDAKDKKAYAITALAITVIATVAVIIAACVTQTWPLLFIAIPFVIGMVPSSYYTHIFRKNVNELESDIAAPGLMKRPVLVLPVYQPEADLDLLQTRVNYQNRLALMTIKQIQNSNIKSEDIIAYELLGRATEIQASRRPAFYAKCISLIQTLGTIQREYDQYCKAAKKEYNKLNDELREWKHQQDNYLWSQENALDNLEWNERQIREARMRGQVINVYTRSHFGAVLARGDLMVKRSEVASGYARSEAQIDAWHEKTLGKIQSVFEIAAANIENQYTAAKAGIF